MTVCLKRITATVFMKIQNISLSIKKIPVSIIIFLGIKMYTILKANRTALSLFIEES